MEPKILLPETQDYLCQLDWPGNVRQLENTCRWITVMASGREVHMADLPPELGQSTPQGGEEAHSSWQEHLRAWASSALANGEQHLLDTALPEFERIMIEAALQRTHGRKRDASILLGWGRNTLTRKMKELNMP